MMGNQKSPFSLSHEWTFLPGNISPSKKAGMASFHSGEATALHMIGVVGAIGSVQIKHLFDFPNKKVHRMIDEGKLVQHTLIRNRDRIPIYTLSPHVAKTLFLPQPEAWSGEIAVQKMIACQFLLSLKRKEKAFRVLPAESSYICDVEINSDIRHLVVLGWEETVISEKVIVIAENMKQANGIKGVREDTRLLLHEDLGTDYRFYKWTEGKWYK